jgi:ribonuclease P protein component
MDVRATASLAAFARVGFVIPRYKHSAVDRNRLKRRLRELVRLDLLPTLRPMDVVFRVSPVAYTRSFDTLKTEMQHAMQQLARLALPAVVLPAVAVPAAALPAVARPTDDASDTPPAPQP